MVGVTDRRPLVSLLWQALKGLRFITTENNKLAKLPHSQYSGDPIYPLFLLSSSLSHHPLTPLLISHISYLHQCLTQPLQLQNQSMPMLHLMVNPLPVRFASTLVCPSPSTSRLATTLLIHLHCHKAHNIRCLMSSVRGRTVLSVLQYTVRVVGR